MAMCSVDRKAMGIWMTTINKSTSKGFLVDAQVMDSLVISLSKFTSVLNPSSPKPALAFGENDKMRMATEAVFALSSRHEALLVSHTLLGLRRRYASSMWNASALQNMRLVILLIRNIAAGGCRRRECVSSDLHVCEKCFNIGNCGWQTSSKSLNSILLATGHNHAASCMAGLLRFLHRVYI
jgi:hypothetical protein